MKERNALLEWYDETNLPQDVHMPGDHPEGSVETSVEDKPVEDKPVEDKPVEKIENLGEMYKALATTKIIESKLTAYSIKESDEDKNKLKTIIKELAKKLGEIVNGL